MLKSASRGGVHCELIFLTPFTASDVNQFLSWYWMNESTITHMVDEYVKIPNSRTIKLNKNLCLCFSGFVFNASVRTGSPYMLLKNLAKTISMSARAGETDTPLNRTMPCRTANLMTFISQTEVNKITYK